MKKIPRPLSGIIAAGAIIGLMVGISGCSAPGESESAEKVLTIGRAFDLVTLDPAVQSTAADYELDNTLYEGLVRYKLGTTEIEPQLATDWTVTDDGLEWTFTLHDGVQFHKGYGEMTAEDVAFSMNRIQDESLASQYSVLMSSVESVTAVDDTTVKFTMANPDPGLLGKLASPFAKVLSQKAVEEFGEEYGQNPVGTGLFEFESWAPQSELVFTNFADYWGEKSPIQKVVYVPVADSTALYRGFDAGDFDMVQVNSLEHYEGYQDREGVTLSQAPLLSVRHLQYSMEKAPFNNPKFREALNYAIDRDTLIDSVFGDMTTPADNWVPPGVNYRVDGLIDYTYDPDKAQELLDEAGYADGATVTLTIPNAERFTTPAVVIQSDLAKVGITVNIEVLEYAAFAEGVISGDGFEFFLLSHSSAATDPDQLMNSLWLSDAIPGSNWSHFSDPEVDEALQRATTTMDQDVRKESFEKVQQIIADANVGYYIDFENYIWAVRDGISGFVPDPMRTLRFDTLTID